MKLSRVFAAGAIGLLAAMQAATQVAAAPQAEEFSFSGLEASDYREGAREYIVYIKDKNSNDLESLSLWTRSLRIIEREGEALVEIKQLWRGDDARAQREIYSLNKVSDFAPIYQIDKRGADGEISAYEFSSDKVVGAKGVDGNAKADFRIEKAANTLNWELDIETFALLPLENGKTFNLNFYHPGSATPPQAYAYTVIGDDVLEDFSGRAIKTWKLRIDYGGRGEAVFWLDQKTGELLKMREAAGDMVRYKVRLGVAGDLPKITLE